jgi:hypothetical protein
VRRAAGYSLLVLGFVLIFMAPLFRLYALPRVEKAPTDIYDRTLTIGTGRYFSPKTLSMTDPRPLQNIAITKGNPAASTARVAVVSLFQRTTDVQAGDDISYQQDTFAFDRSTGLAVHCCGEQPRHQGYTLKLPFGTKRSVVYPFYDITAQRAFPARYERTENVAGLQTYVFVSHVPDTMIGTIDQFPGFLAGQPDKAAVTVYEHYTADTTLWVEPVTGAIVNAAQREAQWATDAQGRFVTALADTNLFNSPRSVQNVARQINSKVFLLVLVSVLVPYLGPVLGVVLLVAAFFLLRVRARRVAPQELAPAAV